VLHATFGSLPRRSRSRHDLAAKLCLAHNFFICSQIFKPFYRNDHHIETTCHRQHLGCYLEGQGHSMTFQQNRVRPIESDFTIILHNWSSYWHEVSCATFGSLFKGQGHIMTFQHNCVRPITSLFEVLFKNYSHKWSPCWDDMSRTTFESLFKGQGHSMTF